MPTIRLETQIAAPVALVFDLARDLDVHARTVPHTNEAATGASDGRRAGPGDTLTFHATHFGLRQRLVSRITRFERPVLFAAFHFLRHTHEFEATAGGTLMRDYLEFTSPLGLLGTLADRLFLERYIRRFLETRNANLKRIAEEAAGRNPLT